MEEEWQVVLTIAPLRERDVHIYRVSLEGMAEFLPICSALLSQQECEQSERRRAGAVREQFVVARASLRALLGALDHVDPRAIIFSVGPHGKPAYTSVYGLDLPFNVAHSKEIVLLAVATSGTVGVDVEQIDRTMEFREIAERYFTAAESDSITSGRDAEEQRRAFYRCWVYKEAVVKADGRGLSLSLSSFEVPTVPVRNALVCLADAPGHPPKSYRVTALPMGSDVAGAVASDLPSPSLKLFEIPFHRLLESCPPD